MLKNIHIERFKCFEKANIALAPLTLFTGFNGAGKSSSLQPLLLIAQALREASNSLGLPLNGSLARLGSAGDVVSRERGGAITLGFSDEKDGAFWVFENDRNLGKHELRLLMSHFSFENDERTQPRWTPIGPHHSLIELIRSVIFLSAVRQVRCEAYPFPDSPGLAVGDVGSEGEYAGYWYVERADEEVEPRRRHPSEERITVRGQIDAWLGDLFPDATVNAESMPGTSLAKLSFRLGRSSDWRRPANVGFGLSYAFPLVVSLVCAEPGQVIIVDSPEAHLHPSGQSTMGKILAHFAANGIQVLVESHSDHLLSGIRLAVRQGIINTEEVMVHFFTGGEAQLEATGPTSLRIQPDGTVEQWPTGFFDQNLKDLVELS